MKFLALLAILVCMPMSSESSSIIRDVIRVEGLQEAIATADTSNTLLVLDVDFTLMHPANPAFQFGSIRRYIDDFQQVRDRLTVSQQDLFATLAVSVEEGSVAVEPKIVEAVQGFQQRGGRAIALTAMLTGDLGEQVGNVCEVRAERLSAQGFDFSGSFPEHPSYTNFTHLPAYQGQHPEYRRGILTSNGEGSRPTKGEMLMAFFEWIGWVPQHILFVDDKRENLLDVSACLEQLQQPVHMTGIHYKVVRAQPATEQLEREQVVAEWDRLAALAIELSQSA